MIDPVLAADPVEQHLDVFGCEAAGEDLPVVGEDLLGHAVGPKGVGEVAADRAARGFGHRPGADDEAGVIIDAGEDLGARPVGQTYPPHDVHLPQLHRASALPAAEPAVTTAPGTRVDERRSFERAIDTRA